MRLPGLLAALLSIAASGDVPARRPSCQADRECVITTFDGCCSGCGCGAGPRAISAAELKSAQARCAVIDCDQKKCEAVRCAARPPASSFRAVCRSGSCQAEPLAAECRADSDCTIAYPSAACRPGPCGCCPGVVPEAVRQTERQEPDEEVARPRPTPPPAPKNEVQFGLSPGTTQPPAPVNCSPCPAPRPAEARCSAGRCVIAAPRVRPPG